MSEKKSNYSNLSSSSLIGIYAERSKLENATKNRSGSTSTVKRPGKKLDLLPNKRDASGKSKKGKQKEYSYDAPTSVTSDKRRQEIMAKKAKTYEQLNKGNTGGLSKAQFESLAIDFDRKADQDYYEEQDNEVDESLTVPAKPLSESSSEDNDSNEEEGEDEEMVEYTDDLGRSRRVPKSQVPRYVYERQEEEESDNDVIYGDQEVFPVYKLTPDEIRKRYKESEASVQPKHFDADEERSRRMGAGYYKFSRDEQERQKQLEALKNASKETEVARQKSRKRQSHVDQYRQNIQNRRKMLLEKRASLVTKGHV